MDKVTFCIPSKSNLRYLKTCIPSIRENAYRKDHDIMIFVDSDEDGTIEWLDAVKDEYQLSYHVNPNLGSSLYGIGKAYDFCIEQSTTDIFMIFHADMMLGKHADLKAFQHLKKGTVVCSTRIEPPLHPNNGEKILLDFGIWPEDWKQNDFNAFVETQLSETKITNGIFAPWMMYKTDFEFIGGHDPILKSCREDSDVFNRMQLAGYEFIQPWNSLVYHLTGRGAGSFDGDPARHAAWKQEMNNSSLEFIRKWGHFVKHDELMKPIIPHKYNIGFRVINCTPQILEAMEPWCDTVYVADGQISMVEEYIRKEQPNTKFNLRGRIRSLNELSQNDITLTFRADQLNNNNINILYNLSDIITDSGEVGEFTLDIFNIEIRKLETYEHQLIKL
jgi:glycosyltransferase involved in cell wall biosynthesis